MSELEHVPGPMSEWIFDKRLPKSKLLTVRWWAGRGFVAKFRFANAMAIHIGRLEVSWRMPWLRRSAMALHPELFPSQPSQS